MFALHSELHRTDSQIQYLQKLELGRITASDTLTILCLLQRQALKIHFRKEGIMEDTRQVAALGEDLASNAGSRTASQLWGNHSIIYSTNVCQAR